MNELPLFPLNVVLFPGQPLKLHIFEERYKLMINKCVLENTNFGVVLLKSGGAEYDTKAEPYPIGCTAQIAQVQRLAEGKLDILVFGRERFQINNLHHDQPYLVGDVELYPLHGQQKPEAHQKGRVLRRVLHKYLTILQEAGKINFDATQIPHDPASLAYLAAIVLQVENDKKQNLLAIRDTVELLQHLIKLYHLESMLLDKLLHPPEHSGGVFSLN